MNKQLNKSLAVRLCSADMSCGFISVEPVLGNRDELIQQRLTWYCERLEELVAELPSDINLTSYLLTEAVELTCADIVCDAIAIAPILYDRNEKILERLLYYFHVLQKDCAPTEEADGAGSIADLPQAAERVDVKAPPRLNKKKKKRR